MQRWAEEQAVIGRSMYISLVKSLGYSAIFIALGGETSRKFHRQVQHRTVVFYVIQLSWRYLCDAGTLPLILKRNDRSRSQK